MAYDLVDIAKESVRGALEQSGITADDLERLTVTGDFERYVAAMVASTIDALTWAAPALSVQAEPEELERTAVAAVFEVIADLSGTTPDAMRLVALISGAAEWAALEGKTDEEIREALELGARELGLELRPTGERDIVDEAGEILAKIAAI